jgi:hypothetical protein
MSLKITQKKIYNPSDSSEDIFTKHLDSGANDAFKKPWHRLERGLRLNRLRVFSEVEANKLQLSPSEATALFSLLSKSLDKKLLNSKSTVIYDIDREAIMEIKGLIMHRGSDGLMRFQIVEKKAGMTFRKRKGDGDTEPTA